MTTRDQLEVMESIMTRCSKASLAGEASPNCVPDFADSRRLAHRLTTSPDEETSVICRRQLLEA